MTLGSRKSYCYYYCYYFIYLFYCLQYNCMWLMKLYPYHVVLIRTKKMPNFSILSNYNTGKKYQEVPLPSGVWNVDFGPPCWIVDKKVVFVSLFARSEEKYIKTIEWISVKLIEFVVVVVVVLICVFFCLICFVIVHDKCGKHTQKKIQTPWKFCQWIKKRVY